MNTETWKNLYNERAIDYEQLVEREDYQGNLLPALNKIHPLECARVVEFGAGTGRISAQILPLVERLWAFDLSPAMLHIANRKPERSKGLNWLLGVGDSRSMPLPDGCADIAIEGWSFLQIAVWHEDAWQEQIGRAISEMLRVVHPGGTAIMIETLGTGASVPEPPEEFTQVYAHIEREWGFFPSWIRTDFLFTTPEQAHAGLGPLFGEAVLDRLQETEDGVLLPECTGIWWREV